MKKEYKTPTMKVRKIQCSHMLCGRTFGINNEVSTEENEFSDHEGYDKAW